MSGISVSVNDAALVKDLDRLTGRTFRAVRSVLEQSAIDVRDEWKANATESAGAHGHLYPSTIRYKVTGPLEMTIEPTEGMKQAGMSFEFGSRNQPPHLDATRAIDRYAPLIRRRIEAVLTF